MWALLDNLDNGIEWMCGHKVLQNLP